MECNLNKTKLKFTCLFYERKLVNMINTFDFSSYFQPSKRFQENTDFHIIQDNQSELKEQREKLLKGLLEHLNSETDSIE